MQNILILLIIVSINLCSSCLKISSSSGVICNNNSIFIDDINKNFTTIMKVSDNGIVVVDIPLYIYSDSSEEIRMTITDNLSLKNADGDTIDTTFYYVIDNTESEIVNNSSFILLSNEASGRDGNTIVGYIRIKVNSLSATQTVGSYSLSKNITVKLLSSGDSPTARLGSSGLVEYVTIVSFENNIGGYTSGEIFINAVLNYGNFNINTVYKEIRDIYVKSNSTEPCTISFTPKNLVSQIDNSYIIGMKYYYGITEIENNTPFTIVDGKNGGSKIGEMKFETERIDSSLIAGVYTATLMVTVSAR